MQCRRTPCRGYGCSAGGRHAVRRFINSSSTPHQLRCAAVARWASGGESAKGTRGAACRQGMIERGRLAEILDGWRCQHLLDREAAEQARGCDREVVRFVRLLCATSGGGRVAGGRQAAEATTERVRAKRGCGSRGSDHASFRRRLGRRSSYWLADSTVRALAVPTCLLVGEGELSCSCSHRLADGTSRCR